MSSRKLRFAAAVAAAVACCQVGLAQEPAGELLDFPHAGIAFAIPLGYQQQIVAQPFELAKAVLSEDGKPAQAVTVLALPLEDPNATPESLADEILAAQSSDLAVRDVEVLNTAAMKAADMPGSARLISYTFRGEETVAASVVFCRQLNGSTTRMQYLVTVEAAADRKSNVLPVLGDVVKSIRLLAVVRPIDMGVCQTTQLLDGPGGVYSVALPHGWYVQPTPAGVSIAQTDYSLAGQPGLTAHVLLRELPSGVTARQEADRCVRAALEHASQAGESGQVVSQGQAKLAGQEAWQVVFEQNLRAEAPAATEPASAPASTQAAAAPADRAPAEPANVIIVRRSLVLPPVGGRAEQQCLSLVVVCPNAAAQAAEAAMDKLADGMKLNIALPAATAPATQPATSAATEAPTAAPADTPSAGPVPAAPPLD